MKPQITEIIGGYFFEWPEVAITAKASRIHVHQDGHISGMLQITHSNGTKSVRLLPTSQFNFSSEVTRTKQANNLKRKVPNLEVEWLDIFDGLGEFIQERELSGTPSIATDTETEYSAPPLLIDPLIYQGHQNIIFGEKGVNKSTIAYALALLLASPEWDSPLEMAIDSKPLTTMVLDWETDQRTFGWYLTRLKRGLGCPPATVYYRHCRLPLIQDIELIADDVANKGVDLLIIDSLGAAAGGESGELKGSQAAIQFNSALRNLPNVTTLILGQTAKGGEGQKSIFGSVYFQYYSRNIFELSVAQENEPGSLNLALFHRDCNFAEKHKPIGIRIVYENNAINLTRRSVDLADFVGKIKDTTAILDILKSGAKDIGQLQKATGLKDNVLRVNLSRLKKQGKVINLSTGMWGLTSGY